MAFWAEERAKLSASRRALSWLRLAKIAPPSPTPNGFVACIENTSKTFSPSSDGVRGAPRPAALSMTTATPCERHSAISSTNDRLSPNGATNIAIVAPLDARALFNSSQFTAQLSRSTSNTIGFMPAARTAPNEAGKENAGTRTGPGRPVANSDAESPAVALHAVTQVSPSVPNADLNPASNLRTKGPKFEYQPRVCISSSRGRYSPGAGRSGATDLCV